MKSTTAATAARIATLTNDRTSIRLHRPFEAPFAAWSPVVDG